ncbi:polysaccharide deacetylase family protein [Pseudoalteromonas sp. HM-SA03]|uniref:polysaccharide deacetylase family protein n=1 Tax=Pseudoalteromonas sp. HM-SA03 TaxID=2029678 RepID=UPI001C3EB818|nr:polysaccharide deacetylase family protein [Pseudoalteromonas sp. HM-SA03]
MKTIWLCTFSLLILPLYVGAKEIALTFDDAPLPGSELMSGEEKTTRIITALKENKVPDALFFVTTNNINSEDAKLRLQRYTQAGFHLANHSYSHLSANKTEVKNYLIDFYQAHLALQDFDNVLNFHRFPYLHYGETHQARTTISENLQQLAQKIGYVTVDNFDWYINAELVAAHRQGKTIDYQKLKQFYVETLWQNIEFYDEIALQTLGRSSKHVLLLHENETAALFLGDLIAYIRAKGWTIISPQEAYTDDIANQYNPSFSFTKQGRVAAIAHAKGVDKKALRHENESTKVLEAKLAELGVFKLP